MNTHTHTTDAPHTHTAREDDTMTTTLKVRVTLTVDVDRESWGTIYGTTDSASEVRDDVRAYVLNHIQQSAAAAEGGIINVRISQPTTPTHRPTDHAA